MTIMSLYAQQLVRYPELGISLDFSKLPLDDTFLSSMQGRIDKAFADMKALESGAIANPDEKRMVGHYWLRNSSLAPTPELKAAIDGPLADVKAFGRDVLDGKITPPRAEQYSAALVIGIGGSALGPELVADAIPAAGLDMFFLDNTDPDGMYRVLESLPLEETLVIVISKSGGTPETRNGMLVAQDFFRKNGLEFAPQAVAVTGVGSRLDKTAEAEGWLKRFPMEDWVGGRTSVMSVVGLVPAVLQGVYMDEPSAIWSRVTVTVSSSPACSSTTSAVMILVVLAMSICSSPFFSYSTWPVSASSRTAAVAETSTASATAGSIHRSRHRRSSARSILAHIGSPLLLYHQLTRANTPLSADGKIIPVYSALCESILS